MKRGGSKAASERVARARSPSTRKSDFGTFETYRRALTMSVCRVSRKSRFAVVRTVFDPERSSVRASYFALHSARRAGKRDYSSRSRLRSAPLADQLS
jgi:hypothetical protein